MKYLSATIVFAVGELVSLLIFAIVKKAFGPAKTDSARKASVLKGILERAVLFMGLLNGFPQILIAFGALKLGTRLYKEKESEISNNYFLVGNLISILMAIIYTIITKHLWAA